MTFLSAFLGILDERIIPDFTGCNHITKTIL